MAVKRHGILMLSVKQRVTGLGYDWVTGPRWVIGPLGSLNLTGSRWVIEPLRSARLRWAIGPLATWPPPPYCPPGPCSGAVPLPVCRSALYINPAVRVHGAAPSPLMWQARALAVEPTGDARDALQM